LGTILDPQPDIQMIDYIIFHVVIIIISATQQYKKTTFNRLTNEVVISSRGILNNKTRTIKLSEIEAIDMSYGRGGNFANGGTVVLITALERINITSSDITKSSKVANKKSHQTINDFVFANQHNE
jgi:hypothetical protein